MLQFEQAYNAVMGCARVLGSELVKLESAVGRVLAQDIVSDVDLPPFRKSAMDGFACRRQDLASELTIVETIAAGAIPQKTVGPNQCARIMTGAQVPAGADCVIMVEFTEMRGQDKVRFTGTETADNICMQGEDIKTGAVVLCKGALLKPQHIGTLATVGCTNPAVAVRPRVGITATGDELVEPGQKPAPSQIRNSNSLQLSAHLAGIATLQSYGVVGDNEEAIDRVLKKAAGENDVVIVTGGVSVGDYDFVPRVLKNNGVRLVFEKIAIKPGKPTVFGIKGQSFCFGLPGNPAACFVIFELLVKPFLYRLMGHNYKTGFAWLELAETIKRRKADRQAYFPVAITDEGLAKAVDYHGSADIEAMCEADGLLCMETGIWQIEKGTVVKVRLI